MKRLAAILLICIFLFNLVGYRFIFNYFQQQSDLALETVLDKDDYNENELVSVVVPLSLPYISNQQNFERISGEISIKGKLYKYVKRRIADGKLILLCLPDHNKMRIQSAREDFFKYTTDLVQNHPTKKSSDTKSNTFKNIMGDFDPLNSSLSLEVNAQIIDSQFSYLPVLYSFTHIRLLKQPPDFV